MSPWSSQGRGGIRKEENDDGGVLILIGTDLWVGPARDDGSCRIGLTERAQALSGPPRFVSFGPLAGAVLSAGDVLIRIESDKWVGRIDVPFDCRVTALNEGLVEEPAILKNDPYGQGWLAELFVDEDIIDSLLENGKARKAAPAVRGSAVLKARGGLVRAEVVLDDDRVSCVRLTGDFHMFPIEALEAVERSVVGIRQDPGPIEAAISEAYEREGIESPGLSPIELAAVIIEAAKVALGARGDKVL